jgi:hypothetical protein
MKYQEGRKGDVLFEATADFLFGSLGPLLESLEGQAH